MFIPNWHGWAQQTNWIEVAPSGAGGWPEEHTSGKGTQLELKKFAQVVWNLAPVNPSTPSNTPPSALTIVETYLDGTDSYICESSIGSDLNDAIWRITRISQNVSGGPTVRYASAGSANLAATDLATVKAYTYS